MQGLVQRLISLFRTAIPTAMVTLLLTWAVLPLAAQSSVPATAVEAARMPQFAKRLAHSAGRPAPPLHSAPIRRDARTRPPQGNDLYDNGPINGNTDAWVINFGFVVSDTITLNGQGSISGMSFGAWLLPGDTLTSVEISITSEPNGGTSYFDQTVNFEQQGACTFNEFGYNVCTETSTNFATVLDQGTYWVNLQNASVPSGNPVYWDENSGDGCQSQGCPSQGYENTVGSIPSESFTILGNSGPPSCSSQDDPQNIRGHLPQAGASGTTPWWETVLHTFGSGSDGSQPGYGSLIMDSAGNLYGTTVLGGTHDCGTVFELSPNGSGGWTEKVIHDFVANGTDGYYPSTGLIMDSAGNLYGGTTYGPGYGILYEVSPSGGGEWTEKVIYAFTGATDGRYPVGLTFDSAGNIFGTTSYGGSGGEYCLGTQGCGTVFELSPAQGGGWTEMVLHSFSAGTDGATPLAPLILDSAGNLYGTTSGGTVFEMMPGEGGSWNFTTLYTFGPLPDGQQPWTGALAFDTAGNLYGTTFSGGAYTYYGVVYELTPNGNGGWTETVLHSFGSGDDGYTPFAGVITDAAGNLYGTTSQGGAYYDGTVYELSPDGSGGWTETILHNFLGGADQGYPVAGLTWDAAGNLYGTTSPLSGGVGTVFKMTPVHPCSVCSPGGLGEFEALPATRPDQKVSRQLSP